MNYPNNIKKVYHKNTDYANRGMDLENLINKSNEYYLENDIAVIYKKPTPIGVVKCDYSKKKIVEAYYKSPSTLDYNGVYKGYYIEFDAKNTNASSLPISNIAAHQVKHIRNILRHKGIIFLLIMINSKCFILSGKKVIDFIDEGKRKSIPYEYIEKEGINVSYNYLKGVNYIEGLDSLIKEIKNDKSKEMA